MTAAVHKSARRPPGPPTQRESDHLHTICKMARILVKKRAKAPLFGQIRAIYGSNPDPKFLTL